MSDKKYIVPEAMLNAAYQFSPASFTLPVVREMLEAAVQWLAENPIIPTVEDANRLWTEVHDINHESITGHAGKDMLLAWQKIMFLEREPEIPEEVKDLLTPIRNIEDAEHGKVHAKESNKRVIEAFRRGRKAGTR